YAAVGWRAAMLGISRVFTAGVRPAPRRTCHRTRTWGRAMTSTATAILALLALVLAYLIGSLSGSLLLARIFGREDPRRSGSGNAGATNALRTGGRGYGAAVLVFDLLKGVVAALLVPAIFGLGIGT